VQVVTKKANQTGRRIQVQGIVEGTMADLPELPAGAQKRIELAAETAGIRLRGEQRGCFRKNAFRPYSGLEELNLDRSAESSIKYALAVFKAKGAEHWKVRTDHQAFKGWLALLVEEVQEDAQRKWHGLSVEDQTTFEAVCVPKVQHVLQDERDKWLLRSLEEETLKVEEVTRAGEGGLPQANQASGTEPSGDESTRTEAGPAVNGTNNGTDQRNGAADSEGSRLSDGLKPAAMVAQAMTASAPLQPENKVIGCLSPKEIVANAKRQQLKCSYEKFASRIGIGRDTMYAITNETRWVSDETYILVATQCNCKPEDLHPRDVPRPERRR
jgi:hypothetical protein